MEKQDSNRVQLEKEIADLLLREKDAVQHKRDELYRNLGKGLSLRLLETPLRTWEAMDSAVDAAYFPAIQLFKNS